MIVIVNGSLGVGKTSTAEQLHARFARSVHLDGDAIGDVNPFDLYDEARIGHLYRTLALLVEHHRRAGFPCFVINYVFETPESLAELLALLRPIDPDVHVFWLTCDPEEQARRIRGRAREDIPWELERAAELRRIQAAAAARGFIGKRLDTTGLTASEAAGAIWRDIHGA